MMTFWFKDLLRGTALISKFHQAIYLHKAGRVETVIGVHNLDLLKQMAGDIKDIASKNGLDAALAGANRLAEKLAELELRKLELDAFDTLPQSNATEDDLTDADIEGLDALMASYRLESTKPNKLITDITEALLYLDQAFEDQIGSRFGVILTQEEARLVSPDNQPLFGNDVYERFPVAADDIAEAGACIAYERGTAAVFHAMRVMEAGLKALGAELGIPYASSWESYIRKMEKLLEGNNYSSLTDAQKKKLPIYRELLGDLVAVKSAWRNPTMHIVRHYDAKQARIIFEAVSALMKDMAEKLTFEPVVSLPEQQPW